MNEQYLSYPIPQFLQACAHSNIIAVHWPILSPVGVREVGILFPLLSALLPGLLLQHTLHASDCFASCNRSDPSVLVAGKLRSRTEILANTGTYLEKKTKKKNSF